MGTASEDRASSCEGGDRVGKSGLIQGDEESLSLPLLFSLFNLRQCFHSSFFQMAYSEGLICRKGQVKSHPIMRKEKDGM